MSISRLLALIRRKAWETPLTSFEEMREALRPQKARAIPPRPPEALKIKKRRT